VTVGHGLDQALVAVHAGDGAGSLLYLRAVQRLPDPCVQRQWPHCL